MQNIRKETVITTDGNTAIIFSTDHLLQALSSTTEIYVDGTFSVSTTAASSCNNNKIYNTPLFYKMFYKSYKKYAKILITVECNKNYFSCLKVLPRIPHIAQFYSVHIRYMNMVRYFCHFLKRL